MRTTSSPGSIPPCAAADPACTTPITAGRLRNASTRSPCDSTTASSSTARIMFIAGPASRIWKRCHLVFDRNSSAAPCGWSSGFSPAIFT